jgi:TRAP-type uncharacterized transport system fused permease subunit
MAYRPLLMNGPIDEVVMTMLSTAVGLIAFAACLDRYLFDYATWFEVLLLLGAAIGLLWPVGCVDLIGFALFIVVLIKQWPRRAAVRNRAQAEPVDQPIS